MRSTLLSAGTRAFAIALIAGACVSALATPVMEMRAEDLLPMASEFKKQLNLNPNQQTLWLQVEGRSRSILRERQSRRERLQASLKTALPGTKVELRDLTGVIEAESAASAQEEKQLRELWLGMNDALDENQRQQVATLFSEQLMRVPDSDQRRPDARPKDDSSGQHRDMGRGKGGGMGGNVGGGMGMPGG
jgi:hypothetical protein